MEWIEARRGVEGWMGGVFPTVVRTRTSETVAAGGGLDKVIV